MILRIAILLTFLAFGVAHAKDDIDLYFSPNGWAADAISNEIKGAKKEILVQAYSFTSTTIAKSLLEAHKRGVKVVAVLDKTNDKGSKYSAAKFLYNAGIEVWIDYKPAIAHSKVMVIDRKTIVTGSYNFTSAAEEKNVENLLIFHNHPDLVKKYVDNIMDRIAQSRPYEP